MPDITPVRDDRESVRLADVIDTCLFGFMVGWYLYDIAAGAARIRRQYQLLRLRTVTPFGPDEYGLYDCPRCTDAVVDLVAHLATCNEPPSDPT